MNNLELIKRLRDMTGASMKYCSEAAKKSCGSLEEAIKWLRANNIVKSVSKKSNEAGESMCGFMKINSCSYIIGKVSFQTDFALSNSGALVLKQLFAFAFRSGVYNIDSLMSVKAAFDEGSDDISGVNKSVKSMLGSDFTCKDYIDTVIGLVGENVIISDFMVCDFDAHYVHNKMHFDSVAEFGSIGVFVKFSGQCSDKEKVFELGKDISMHASFTNPLCLSSDSVSQKLIDTEKEIRLEQAVKNNTPKDKIEFIVANQLKKYINEVSLNSQDFIKDSSVKISDLISRFNKDNSSDLKIEMCVIISNNTNEITVLANKEAK